MSPQLDLTMAAHLNIQNGHDLLGFAMMPNDPVHCLGNEVQHQVQVYLIFLRDDVMAVVAINGENTWKHACFCAFMFKIYMKAQKHACFKHFLHLVPPITTYW